MLFPFMKTLKIITVILLYFVFSGTATRAQDAAPDGEYQSITKTYTLHPAGDWTFRYQHQLKLLTYYAINSLYGETFIVYNPNYQKLKINKVVTTMADGTLVPSPENAFNEVLPKYATNFPESNMLREMVVTHTGLECGATTALDYEINTAAGFYPALMGNEVLQSSSPTGELTIILRIPDGSVLKYNLLAIKSEPVITKEKGMQVYTFTFKNLAALTHDDFQARDQRFLPRLLFSTGKGLNAQLTDMARQSAFTYSASGNLKSTCDLLVKNYPEAFSRIMKIQDIIVNELNYFPVPAFTMGFKFRTPFETWTSNGGTETEKAVLMAAMLNACGFDASAVFVLPKAFDDPASASLLAIEKVLVQVSAPGLDKLLISPLQTDAQDLKFNLSGKKLIPVGKVIGTARELNASGNALSLSAVFAMDLNGKLSGDVSLGTGGTLNPALKLRNDNTYNLIMLTGAFHAADIRSGETKKTNSETTEVTYKILTADSMRQEAGYYFWKLPMLASGTDGWKMAELAGKRNTPLEIPMLINESYTYKVTLPRGMTLVTPATELYVNPGKVGQLRIMISQQGDVLLVSRTLTLDSMVIEPENYDAFRNLMNTWNEKKYREIVLKR
jgi:hypothetical protein